MATADSSPLKRSFLDALGQEPFLDRNPPDPNGSRVPCISSFDCRSRSVASPAKRRSISYSGPYAMTAETSASIHTTFPSFMAVFGGGTDAAKAQEDASHGSLTTSAQHGSRMTLKTAKTQPLPRFHYFTHSSFEHRGSHTSLTSVSTESSPTTTVSTFDSPSITDPSPSSSPESPTSAIPLSPFKQMMHSPEELSKQNGGRDQAANSPGLTYQTQSDPQASGLRNVKNLSLNMAVSTPARPATSSGVDNFHTLPTPTSPLREPGRNGRKRPNNLTIRTPGFDQLTFIRTAPEIPPTPNSRPHLQHIQSSPALPSLTSPSLGPWGGMDLPLPPFIQGHSRPGSNSGSQSSFGTQSVVSSLGDLKEEDQPLKSQEVQEQGYVNGPVQIYDSGVYLYLEPTVEEASRFDTVINVAQEVKNPFEDSKNESKTVMAVWREMDDRSTIPEPQTAISEISFKSAFEWPQSTASDMLTPTTPTQASNSTNKQPEYIHVPWDHNSEIINDLFPLCQIIDSRVSSGKTVLVHCQLGVSRSASLVIAYGLYKGYHSTFPTMYDAVKARSRWVGPNMSLIYQLGDFRRQVERKEYLTKTREPPEQWFKNKKSDASNDSIPLIPASAASQTALRSISTDNERPAVPPKPALLRLNKKLPPVPLFSESPIQEKPPSLPTLKPATYRPPSSITPSRTFSPFGGQPPTSTQATNRPLPLRDQFAPTRDIPPHRPRKETPSGLVISRPPAQMDLAMQDVPSTPSLFSPRATEFMASPFGLTAAGDLHAGSTATMPSSGFDAGQQSPAEVDPRSPHQRDDNGEILRHIDDIL